MQALRAFTCVTFVLAQVSRGCGTLRILQLAVLDHTEMAANYNVLRPVQVHLWLDRMISTMDSFSHISCRLLL